MTPMLTPDSSLPSHVRIREVGPRDGFQNEPERIATEDKVRLIEMLGATGLKRLEITSFVLPDEIARSVIVPTPKGLDNALESGLRIDQITVFLSASESHNRANVNRSIEQSLAGLEQMLPRIREAGRRAGAAISTSFGCPYEGIVEPAKLRELSLRLAAAGAEELVYGDTTGMANPVLVREFFLYMREALGPEVELTAHFHNTRGQGLANVIGALEAGCESFESSFGELGGCPVPPGATGNIASEDLVSMLHEMGIETGIDLEALLAASRAVQEVLGRPLSSHTLVAGPVDWDAKA
jgi:hydroxymethylglutaryl-CoA lyase